jgi:murein DD-endopeptidase MepM/ murein hydrolase activator NlpD
MSAYVHIQNATFLDRFQRFFRPRDLFIHDGGALRRVTLNVQAQIGIAVVAVLALVGLAFAIGQAAAGATLFTTGSGHTAEVARMERAVAGMHADVARLRDAARAHAARLEERQAFLAAVLSGEADGAKLAALIPEGGALATPRAAADIVSPLAALEDDQLVFADRVKKATDARYRSTVSALRKLGIDPSHLDAAGAAMGGPYEPVETGGNVTPIAQADPKFRSLFLSWKKLDQIQQGVVAVPSAKPIETNVSFTSSFGIRSDPFRGGAAMHAGIDLAGPIGTPIYATADGVVSRAEWANGYGNLIQVEHGKGIQTRYGHLSQILVAPNTRVKRGELIGKMGSTGRSTGSHLHYEVRIDGHAVNPLPFIQSSDYLLALQQRSVPIAHASMGGPEQLGQQ